MTSLTKASLLALKPKASKVEVKGLGEIWLKPLTELLRSRRLTELFGGKDGAQDPKVAERRRAQMIVDQLCEGESGEAMFSQAEINDILQLDSLQLDALCDAIYNYNEEQEKNVLAELS
jgi:predicted lipoprotein